MNNSTLFAAAFKHAVDGLIITDREGIIQLVNPALSAIFGYRDNELTGWSAAQLMDWPPLHSHQNQPCEFKRPDTPLPLVKKQKLTGRKKDGSLFDFQLSLSEIKDKHTAFYIGNVHDLSHEKKIEAALIREQHRNKIKARLVSMASHEFRSPLSLIQLSTSLIERYYQRLDREKIMEHLQKIKSAIGDMTATLNDFLSLERIEAGSLQPEQKPFSLTNFAEELTGQMQLQAGAEQQIVYKHQGEDMPVVSDRNLLKHCVTNLLSNAIKYSPEVCLIEFTTAIKDSRFILTISDQGIGIPKADQKKLFEAFFRASNAAELPGTGLGLYIVQSYVQQLGGNIQVKSGERLGTTFTLSFPVLKEKKATRAYQVA